MKIINNKFISSLLALTMGVILFVPTTLAGTFGVSPPWIVNENLKPGSSFVYVITLSTNDPVQDVMVETEVTGDSEIADWITIRNQDSLTMPAGQQLVPMHIELNVPADARVGRYNGNIALKIVPKTASGEQVSILLGGNIAVEFQVISYDVTDYWVKSAALQSTETGQPIRINITAKNLGNTVLTDLPVQMDILDYKTGDKVATASGTKLVSPIYPHTVKESEMILHAGDLDKGNYWVKLNVLKDGSSVYQNRLYLTVNGPKNNSVVSTDVSVTDKQGAVAKYQQQQQQQQRNLRASATSPLIADDVTVKTSVVVKAPFTNQLIGIVIALLVVLIIITGKIYSGLAKKRKHHRKH